jgi:hypothetical protein
MASFEPLCAERHLQDLARDGIVDDDEYPPLR